jgi:septum site-determining protein MinC
VEIRELLRNHELELWAVLTEVPTTREAARRLALATRLPGSKTDLDGNSIQHATDPAEMPETEMEQGANGLLLRETIRSGRSVYHEGHVIIIGDVNPGAEIIAGGDVIVWGKLRGLVHAGALGNAEAVICALELIPTQLRIADQIAISPRDQRRSAVPEKVSIRDGQLIAEAWPRK